MTTAAIAQMECDLTAWEGALTAARSGQAYAIDGVSLTRQDIPEIRNQIRRIRRDIRTAQAAGAGAVAPSMATFEYSDPWA